MQPHRESQSDAQSDSQSDSQSDTEPGSPENSEEQNTEDLYADFDAEADRVAALFADPVFREREQARQAADEIAPIKRRSAGNSFGNALALGFANVFDPDRQRDDIVAVQERGDDDGDVPETTLDPDDPTSTRVVYKPGQIPR